MTTPRDLNRLAEAVKRRRLELELPRLAAAKSAGISKGTWQRVEEGQPVREMNYAKIDATLGWATHSCILISEGGDPVPVESAQTKGIDIATTPVRASKETEARQVVQNAAIATIGHLTADEIRTLSERIVEDLKARGVID